MKKIIVISLLLVIILSYIYYMLYDRKPDDNMVYQKEAIVFDSIQDTLYFCGRIWGISGNHEEIVLSPTIIDKETWNYNKESCYIFYSSELFYKVVYPNKLIIYAPFSAIGEIPSYFDKKKFQIEINELRTYKEVSDYSKNHLKLGFNKFRI